MSRAFEATRSRANFRISRSSACSVGKCAISAAWALALLSGCGSGGPSDLADEASADEPSSTLTREVLDRLDLGGYELSFERVSTGQGPDTVMLVETLYASDRLEGLTRAYGPLTSLETFLAFAPEGSEPHPFLVAAHESEAQGLGRSGEGLAVRFVDGRNLPIEKAIAFECDNTSARTPISSPLLQVTIPSTSSTSMASTSSPASVRRCTPAAGRRPQAARRSTRPSC